MSRTLIAALVAGLFMSTAAVASGPPKSDGSKGTSRLTSSPSYVPLPPLTAATPLGRGIGGMITAEFGLDIPDARLRTRVQAMRPRVLDAVRGAVADYALTHYRAGTAPDPTQITLMAQQSVDRTVGATGARVLIANLMVSGRR